MTVLEVTDDQVVVGDPAHGLRTFTPQEFLNRWRFVGVVLKRSKP